MNGQGSSLAVQVVWRVLLAQVLAVLAWLLVFMMMSPYLSYEEVAAAAVRSELESSLSAAGAGTEGQLRTILAGVAARRPGLEIAVTDRQGMLASPNPQFAREIAPLLAAIGRGGELTDADGRSIRASLVNANEHELLVITRGDIFLAGDLPIVLISYLPQVMIMLAPALLAVTIVSPWAINLALRNVRTASARAGQLQLGSLDEGIPEAGLPREIRPLVQAINRLLERLSGEVQEKEVFMANAAHEIRTPVAILSARVDGLAHGSQRTALQADARRLSALVDQLLAAARLQHKGVTTWEKVSVAGIVLQVVSDIAPVALRQGKHIAFDDASADTRIRGDHEALRSAIMNLVDNGVRAARPGGTVSISLRQTNAGLALSVSDDGEGIARQHQQSVFEAFWRGRPEGPGTGLGLAITRHVVEMHSGLITVDSAAGKGATFTVTFPEAVAVHTAGLVT